MVRHGTRNPSDDDILAMAAQLPQLRDAIVAAWEEGRGSMSEEDIAELMVWTFELQPEQEYRLTE